MGLRFAIVVILSSCSWLLQCQSETAVVRGSASSLSTPLPSPPPPPPHFSSPTTTPPLLSDPSASTEGNGEGEGEGGEVSRLLLVLIISMLSVVGGGVIVTLVIVWAVRLRRAYREWYAPTHSRPEKTIEIVEAQTGVQRESFNGVNVQLLSAALSNSNFEWTQRPLSHSPASSTPDSSIHLCSPPRPPSSLPSTHEYSEIESLSPDSPAVRPTPPPPPSSSHPHCYEDVDEEDVLKTDSEWRKTQQLLHTYSQLDGPSPPPCKKPFYSHGSQPSDCSLPLDVHNSIRDSLSSSQGSSYSLQNNKLNWIISPVTRPELLHSGQPRRVIPYRVSLILPLWREDQDKPLPPPPPPPVLGHYSLSTSCIALTDTGRYNYLKETTAKYGSLEENSMYASLEPFTGSVDPMTEPKRPRSRSCGARLYNHLRHH